jgi:hypothetical protein
MRLDYHFEGFGVKTRELTVVLYSGEHNMFEWVP